MHFAIPRCDCTREGGPFHASLTSGEPGIEGFKEYLKYLEATSRAEGADQLRKKYARQLEHFGRRRS